MLTKREDQFSETKIDDEFVVMVLGSGDFLSLAGTAGVIWDLIDGTRTRETIVTELTATYDAPGEEIAADVDEFLASLRKANLVAGD